jgi:tRNA (guanine37-N1)-methyltransferase
MKIDVVSLFPQMVQPVLEHGNLKRAIKNGILSVHLHQLREFAADQHRTVDDYPYGGGAGMILKPEPIFKAVESLRPKVDSRIIFFTPQGQRLDQRLVEILSLEKHLILICGRYKGIDERVRFKLVTDEISVGDYVLSGGEIAAQILIDTIGRVLPSAIGDYQSAQDDSFSQDLLDHPHYTRPAEFRGMRVPEILLSGHHQRIQQWRYQKSLDRTNQRRPDLAYIHTIGNVREEGRTSDDETK